MRHLMPIVTPRLILRPPRLGDLDSIQTAKEEAWPDLQRWMTWAFDNQLSRQAMEDSIRRTMDYQNQAGIALAGFHRINGDFVVRTALDLTDEQDVYETGYWVAPKYAGQGMATEAANAAIRYAFGHLGGTDRTHGDFEADCERLGIGQEFTSELDLAPRGSAGVQPLERLARRQHDHEPATGRRTDDAGDPERHVQRDRQQRQQHSGGRSARDPVRA
jgi:RimJ/RimL family protein N-acetyltransferase